MPKFNQNKSPVQLSREEFNDGSVMYEFGLRGFVALFNDRAAMMDDDATALDASKWSGKFASVGGLADDVPEINQIVKWMKKTHSGVRLRVSRGYQDKMEDRPMSKAAKLIESVINEQQKLWYVHLDVQSIAPGTKEYEDGKKFKALEPFLKKAGVNVKKGQVYALGYDDISIEFDTPTDALKAAKKLDKVLPTPSKFWKTSMGPVKTHAQVVGPYDSDSGDELPDSKQLY